LEQQTHSGPLMRIRPIGDYTNRVVCFQKRLHIRMLLLVFGIILGILSLSIGYNHAALSADTALPRLVLKSIVDNGTNARKEEISKTSTRFSRRAAATKFSSQVISALANYPDHADIIIETAINLGRSHRQYIAKTIVNTFPGYKKLISSKLANTNRVVHKTRETKSPTKAFKQNNYETNKEPPSTNNYHKNVRELESYWKRRTFRISFEEVEMPVAGEQMGLYGLGYFQEFYPWFYGGLNAFGAATGERGGFFTGGFTSGLKFPLLKRLYADTSFYVGAGGGGDAPQGGGLMLRPYVGLFYDFGQYSLGLGYSHVEFPNGDIESDSISLQLDTNFQSATEDWFTSIERADNYFDSSLSKVSRHRSHISIRSRFYNPTTDSKNVSGNALNKTIGVVGINYAYFLNKHLFIDLESAGAFSGNVGGYAELLGGIGLRQGLTTNDRLAILPSITFGGAGGGAVDTGGGFVTRANLGLEYRLARELSIIGDGGYMTAPDGNFEAPYVGFNISYVTENLSLDKKGTLLSPNDKIRTERWRIRPIHQWYFDAPRKSSASKDMELLGAKFDWMPGNWWYLTGQALSAYAGGAGGYSEGLWGVGAMSPNIGSANLFLETLIGAGGGGGVDSSSALIFKAASGLSYKISRNLSLELSVGRLVSREGSLDVNFLDTALVYHLGSPVIQH